MRDIWRNKVEQKYDYIIRNKLTKKRRQESSERRKGIEEVENKRAK